MECHGVLSVQVRGLNQSMTDEQLAKALKELTIENEQREASPEMRQRKESFRPFRCCRYRCSCIHTLHNERELMCDTGETGELAKAGRCH